MNKKYFMIFFLFFLFPFSNPLNFFNLMGRKNYLTYFIDRLNDFKK